MSIESMMPSNHLILCHPLILWPSIFPSMRVFSNESVLRIRWPKYWSFSFNISPSSEHSGLISFRMDLLQSRGLSKVFSNTTVQKHQFSALISMAKKLSTKQLKLIFLSELVCFYPTPLRSLFPRHSGPSLKPLSTFFPFHSHFVAQLKHFVSVVHAIAVMKLTPFPPCFSLLRHHHSLHTTRRSSKIWLWLCFFSYSVTFRMALH